MITLGTTLRCNLPPRHIWVVLSNPARTSDEILLVNFTTLTDDTLDDACILQCTDFPLLSQATAVAYSRAQVGTVAKLDALVQAGTFSVITPVSTPTLEKILAGARVTPELSEAKRNLVG